jgi:hypothetical protein
MEQELIAHFGWDFFGDLDLEPYMSGMDVGCPEELLAIPGLDQLSPPMQYLPPREYHVPAHDQPQPEPGSRLSPDLDSVTPESIIARREVRFWALERLALARLHELLERGRDEYTQQGSRGTLNRVRLISRYLQAGRLLEKNIDGVFHGLVVDMKRDLEQHNAPTDITRTIEAAYVSQKHSRRSEFLGRIQAAY